MDYDRIVRKIFRILEDRDVRRLYLKNCNNINISNNEINKYFIIGNYGLEKENRPDKIRIAFKEQRVDDKGKRAELNADCFERFISACNREQEMPTIRCYGLFSQLSSLRSRGDFSDYNQLVLREKDFFDKMVGLNYKVKIIASLDIPAAVYEWGYSLEQTSLRIIDLCNHVNYVSEHNKVEIVADRYNAMHSRYILDHNLLIDAIEMDPENKYSVTKYETNPYKINNAIRMFDERFIHLKAANDITGNTLKCETKADVICKIVEGHMEEYYRLLNGELLH